MAMREKGLLLILLKLLLQAIMVTAYHPQDAAVDECCFFHGIQSGCSNTFTVGEGDALSCTLTTQTSLPDESCVVGASSVEETNDNRGSPSPRIELLTAEAIDVHCGESTATHSNQDPKCPDYHQKRFIAVKITFQIRSSANVIGVLFDLSDTRHNCHYLRVPDIGGQERAVNRSFTYTGFAGLHPGSKYQLRAAPMFAGMSSGPSSDLSFSIPDCKNLSSWSSHYYCSLPSPAKWHSHIIVEPNSLDVTFTLWPELSTFRVYNLYLFLGDEFIDHNMIEKVTFLTSESEKIETVSIAGKEFMAIRHAFIVDLPGTYTIIVLPQPDDACERDPHWGNSLCRYGHETVEIKIASSHQLPLPSHELTKAAVFIPSLTPSSSPEEYPSSDAVDPLLLGIFTSVVFFVVLLIISVLCCCRDHTISRYMFHTCKSALPCNKASSHRRPSDSLTTVTTNCVHRQYQPVPLKRGPLPQQPPSTLDDLASLGTIPPSIYSDATSDSVSQIYFQQGEDGGSLHECL